MPSYHWAFSYLTISFRIMTPHVRCVPKRVPTGICDHFFGYTRSRCIFQFSGVAMGKLSDVEIRNWIKTGERFEARGDGDGLYLRFREGGTLPVWRFRYRLVVSSG